MATQDEIQSLYDRIAALRETVTSRLAPSLIQNPQLADVIVKQIDDLLASVVDGRRQGAAAARQGPGRAGRRRPRRRHRASAQTRIPQGVEPYDETVTSERIVAVGDLYYIYQHEQIGVFRVVQKLQELFRGGRRPPVRRRRAPIGLYQFDRREVLRYTQRDRLAAYRRVLGYGRGLGAAGLARRTPTSTPVHATSSTRSRCSGATSGSPT